MKEFLAMGGYGVYVWSAYAIVAAVICANVAAARLRRKRIIREVREHAEEV